tara:strand:- start:359 stop:1300 length:942 start_codon:yes stop_codon:yes gene_type:complete
MKFSNILEDKFIGSFIGLSLGDALGAPYEGGLIERFLWKFFSKTPTGKMRWTDDTQMSIDIAETLIEKKKIDVNFLAQKFASSYKWSRGYGPAAGKVLKSIRKGTQWEIASRETYREGSLGNGGAMRSPLIGLMYFDNEALLIKEISKATKITHGHPLAIEGAVLIGRAISLALNKNNSIDIIKKIIEHSKDNIFRERSRLSLEWLKNNSNISPKEISKNLGNGIRATDSCITSIYLALRFNSSTFLEMIQFARRCGGDVDTLCSMSGSIWGAFNGFKNIPKELFYDLEDGNRIKSLACNLYKTKLQLSEKIN